MVELKYCWTISLMTKDGRFKTLNYFPALSRTRDRRVPQGPTNEVSEFIEDPSKAEISTLTGPSTRLRNLNARVVEAEAPVFAGIL